MLSGRHFSFGCGALVLAAVISFGFASRAQELPTHRVVVILDETSVGDLKILEHALNDGIAGEEVSMSVRKVAMSAIGETWLAMESRIDAANMLTLDDGTSVLLTDEADIEVQAKGKKFQPGATIVFKMVCTKLTQKCRRQPVTITLTRPDGSRVCSSFPPKHLGQLEDGGSKFCEKVPF